MDPTPEQPAWSGFPGYCVLFTSKISTLDVYEPIAHVRSRRELYDLRPHELDPDIKPALSAIWYCLHLPRTFFDTRAVSAGTVATTRSLGVGQRILFAPFPAVLEAPFLEALRAFRVDLILCPDEIAEQSLALADSLGVRLGVTAFSALGQETLEQHWRRLAELAPGDPSEVAELTRLPTLSEDTSLSPLRLPAEFLGRLCGIEGPPAGERRATLTHALEVQLLFATALEAERRGVELSPTSRDALEGIRAELRKTIEWPVVVALGGIPGRHEKGALRASRRANRAGPGESARGLDPSSDLGAEGAVLELLSTHTALAESGVGLSINDVDKELFQQLAQIEYHCSQRAPQGKTVWRLLKDLGRRTAALFHPDDLTAVRRASRLIVHSSFPLGLAILPGDTAPLVCSAPVSYRPVVPLTRALQVECVGSPPVYLGDGFRMLIAECLEDEDKIKPFAAVGWDLISETLSDLPNVEIDLRHISSIQALSNALREKSYDILVLSAHGHYNPDHNVAGIVIGKELLVGAELELGGVPPLVVLSACHVAPRGVGAVTIADLLLRQGAMAVLGTLVPVNVNRNATLMARFFTYIAQSILGNETHSTVGEAWAHTAASNALNDVLLASRALMAAIHGDSLEDSVFYEFMMKRSIGRLRKNHVYSDTETILKEIFDDRGYGPQFRGMLASQSYIPETLFYVFFGAPERILLRPPPHLSRDHVGVAGYAARGAGRDRGSRAEG